MYSGYIMLFHWVKVFWWRWRTESLDLPCWRVVVGGGARDVLSERREDNMEWGLDLDVCDE